MLIATFVLFMIFVIFQIMYIFIPLFFVKNNCFKRIIEEKAISILIPAFNEEKIILNCLQGIVNLDYKNFEAIFINDGSTDQTFRLLYELLELVPDDRLPVQHIKHEGVLGFYRSTIYSNVYVINKNNGEKQTP